MGGLSACGEGNSYLLSLSAAGTLHNVDAHALRVVEFHEVLKALVAHCETEAGAVRAEEIIPAIKREIVESQLRETGEAKSLYDRDAPPSLGLLRDVSGPVEGSGRGLTLSGETLFRILESLMTARKFRDYLVTRKESAPTLAMRAMQIPSLAPLEREIDDKIGPDGTVRDHASPELAKLRGRIATLSNRIVERMQALSNKLRESLSDVIVTQRSGRWCLPVRADFKGRVKGLVHDTSASGQTLYIEPEEIVNMGNQLREVEAAARFEEERILRALSDQVGKSAAAILAGLEACVALDVVFAKARLAVEWNAVEPTVRDKPELTLRQARHPLIDPEVVVPTDLEVGRSFQALLITGPNTGGKTVSMKLAGLCVAMAQSGMHVPAVEASLGVFPQLWADIGDEQSLQQSLSTFSAHLRNIQRMIAGVRTGALVLLDEIGAGTDPAEGAALAKAILMRLVKSGALVICSTHYGELKAFAYNTPGMQNAAMEFDIQSLRPTYRLKVGAPGASHALTIAERFGIPKDVLDDARSGLSEAQQDIIKMLDKLEQAQQDAERAKRESDEQAAALRRERSQLDKRLAQTEDARSKARDDVRDQLDEVRREIRDEAEKLFAALKNAQGVTKETHKIREELRVLDTLAAEYTEEVAPVEKSTPRAEGLRVGDMVRVIGYGTPGKLLSDPANERVQVQIGLLKMTVDVGELEAIEPAKDKRKAQPTSRLSLERAMQISPEVHLRLKRAEDAMAELEKYLDDAVFAGLDRVRVVHGKGTGTLRKLAQEMLRKHPSVAAYRLGEEGEGGTGVTIVELKR